MLHGCAESEEPAAEPKQGAASEVRERLKAAKWNDYAPELKLNQLDKRWV
jgi:hypothetical protein